MALLGLLAVSPLWGEVPINSKSLVLRLVGGYAIPFSSIGSPGRPSSIAGKSRKSTAFSPC